MATGRLDWPSASPDPPSHPGLSARVPLPAVPVIGAGAHAATPRPAHAAPAPPLARCPRPTPARPEEAARSLRAATPATLTWDHNFLPLRLGTATPTPSPWTSTPTPSLPGTPAPPPSPRVPALSGGPLGGVGRAARARSQEGRRRCRLSVERMPWVAVDQQQSLDLKGNAEDSGRLPKHEHVPPIPTHSWRGRGEIRVNYGHLL